MTPTEASLHCEARKWSYRQTKEGVVISFLLHPNELPDGLALAPLGTRFMLAVCEISDQETPVKPKEKTPKSFHDMSLAQQAGMLCSDEVFQKFMFETGGTKPENIADTVRGLCGVKSRSDIKPGTEAARRWFDIVSDYRAWQHEPEVLG
jgi:hypothetical protein